MDQPTAEDALKRLEPLVGEWELWRDGEPFPQRFIATISEDGNTIAGGWEKAMDGRNFATDFELTYRRLE